MRRKPFKVSLNLTRSPGCWAGTFPPQTDKLPDNTAMVFTSSVRGCAHGNLHGTEMQLTNMRETGTKPPGSKIHHESLLLSAAEHCVTQPPPANLPLKLNKLFAVVMSMCGCASPHITAPRQGYCSFWYSAQSRKMLELHTWQLFSSCVHAKLQTLVHIIKKNTARTASLLLFLTWQPHQSSHPGGSRLHSRWIDHLPGDLCVLPSPFDLPSVLWRLPSWLCWPIFFPLSLSRSPSGKDDFMLACRACVRDFRL